MQLLTVSKGLAFFILIRLCILSVKRCGCGQPAPHEALSYC
jgi:hypothetical protein